MESLIAERRALGELYYEKESIIIENSIAILRTGFFWNSMQFPQKLSLTTMIQNAQYLPRERNCSSLLVLEGGKSLE